MATLYLAIALIILIAVNIFLGTYTAMFSSSFDWKRFRTGIYKGGVIFLCVALVYFAGFLTQDIIAFEVFGQTVNLMQATYLVILYSYIYYGKNIVLKLIKLFTGGNAKISEPPDTIIKAETNTENSTLKLTDITT